MSAFLAVVGDTWRQSKQQVVFLVMCVLLLVTVACGVFIPSRIDKGADAEPEFGTVFSDEATDFGSQNWWDAFAASKALAEGEQVSVVGNRVRIRPSEKEARREADGMTEYERSVIGWGYFMETMLIRVALMLFLAACAGYFPAFLSAGAVDAVLSKPVSRLQVFMGKFVGGLMLFAAAMFAVHIILFVGLGLRLGVWHPHLFLALPFQLFTAATLYAFMAFLGITFRTSVLPLVLGYVYYVMIDTGLGAFMDLGRLGMLDDFGGLNATLSTLRNIIPNFSNMNGSAALSTLRMPYMDTGPFLAAACWMVVTLAGAFWMFRRRDF